MDIEDIAFIILTIVVVFGVLSILFFVEDEVETKSVPCYDRYGNEIVGIFCIEETHTRDNFFFCLLVISAISSLLVLIFRFLHFYK